MSPPPTAGARLPAEFQTRSLRRRSLQAVAALSVLIAIFLLAPGLGEVRDILAGASPGWLLLAGLFEAQLRRRLRPCSPTG